MFRKKENAKIQVLFKVYGQFLSTFQDKNSSTLQGLKAK